MCAEMTRQRAEEFGAARNSSAVRMFVSSTNRVAWIALV
jgi:hypothetical protein